jgi:uncharacterized LabA/DUF88 family protein
LVVFFDWQNVYMRARESFFDPADPPAKGQADPVDLAHVLRDDYARRHQDDVELTQIRIYRGRPTQQADPRGYAAFHRQDAVWRRNRLVVPHYNDLRYPEGWGQETCTTPPREKGIDVALAVDLVTLALDQTYDAAIVMSADYDLVPAIDFLVRRRLIRGEGPSVEVAAWRGEARHKPLRLRLPGRPLYCIWLDQQKYWGVEDSTDYRTPTTRSRPAGPRPGSWLQA